MRKFKCMKIGCRTPSPFSFRLRNSAAAPHRSFISGSMSSPAQFPTMAIMTSLLTHGTLFVGIDQMKNFVLYTYKWWIILTDDIHKYGILSCPPIQHVHWSRHIDGNATEGANLHICIYIHIERENTVIERYCSTQFVLPKRLIMKWGNRCVCLATVKYVLKHQRRAYKMYNNNSCFACICIVCSVVHTTKTDAKTYSFCFTLNGRKHHKIRTRTYASYTLYAITYGISSKYTRYRYNMNIESMSKQIFWLTFTCEMSVFTEKQMSHMCDTSGTTKNWFYARDVDELKWVHVYYIYICVCVHAWHNIITYVYP